MPPNGVSIRFPPANGRVGSAVWQLAQSPATVSALPLAITSGDGGTGSSALAWPQLNAVHKRPMRIAHLSHRHARIDRSPVQASIAAKTACYVVSSGLFLTTHPQKASGRANRKLRFVSLAIVLARFVMRRASKPT